MKKRERDGGPPKRDEVWKLSWERREEECKGEYLRVLKGKKKLKQHLRGENSVLL